MEAITGGAVSELIVNATGSERVNAFSSSHATAVSETRPSVSGNQAISNGSSPASPICFSPAKNSTRVMWPSRSKASAVSEYGMPLAISRSSTTGASVTNGRLLVSNGSMPINSKSKLTSLLFGRL